MCLPQYIQMKASPPTKRARMSLSCWKSLQKEKNRIEYKTQTKTGRVQHSAVVMLCGQLKPQVFVWFVPLQLCNCNCNYTHQYRYRMVPASLPWQLGQRRLTQPPSWDSIRDPPPADRNKPPTSPHSHSRQSCAPSLPILTTTHSHSHTP